MIFGNKQCEDNHVVSINGMNIKRVYVTKFLGVHIDSHLNWCEHINHIKSKISKNVSIMRRVKHLLINSALYSLYSTLVMPYLNYCCDMWGNTYKSRIQPLHSVFARIERGQGADLGKGHFCARPIILRALLRVILHFEGTLGKLHICLPKKKTIQL